LFRQADLMTIAASFWPRRFPRLNPPAERLFEVEPGSSILARCQWQADPGRHPTLVLLHGLEGSSESGYMLGAAETAFDAGFNVLRLNQRNCGGTDHLTPTLYNSGLSGDVGAVVAELIASDQLPEIFLAGFSMGGNLVLKLAGELGERAPGELCGVSAVSPTIDLASCVDALAAPRNRMYQWYFVSQLKQHMRRKAELFPERYSLDGLRRVRTVREFDDVITAPHCGFQNAADYYARSSALRVLPAIRVPTLLLVAQDDPIVPFVQFESVAVARNPFVELLAPACGGHCAFLAEAGGAERFWAEARIADFCRQNSRLAGAFSSPA